MRWGVLLHRCAPPSIQQGQVRRPRPRWVPGAAQQPWRLPRRSRSREARSSAVALGSGSRQGPWSGFVTRGGPASPKAFAPLHTGGSSRGTAASASPAPPGPIRSRRGPCHGVGVDRQPLPEGSQTRRPPGRPPGRYRRAECATEPRGDGPAGMASTELGRYRPWRPSLPRCGTPASPPKTPGSPTAADGRPEAFGRFCKRARRRARRRTRTAARTRFRRRARGPACARIPGRKLARDSRSIENASTVRVTQLRVLPRAQP